MIWAILLGAAVALPLAVFRAFYRKLGITWWP